MLKKIGMGLVCLGIVSGSVMAANSLMLSTGMHASITLMPNDPYPVKNIWFWKINGVCKMKLVDREDTIRVRMLDRTAVVNGKSMNKGDMFDLIVHNGDTMKISASSGAEVQLTNLGDHEIIADCAT